MAADSRQMGLTDEDFAVYSQFDFAGTGGVDITESRELSPR